MIGTNASNERPGKSLADRACLGDDAADCRNRRTRPNDAPLHDLLGLPGSTSPADLARAAEKKMAALYAASGADLQAFRELVALRVAYLNWAYSRGLYRDADHADC